MFKKFSRICWNNVSMYCCDGFNKSSSLHVKDRLSRQLRISRTSNNGKGSALTLFTLTLDGVLAIDDLNTALWRDMIGALEL